MMNRGDKSMSENTYICRVCGEKIIYKGRQLYRRQHSHLGTDICFKCAKLDANKRISSSVKKLWKDDEYKNRLIQSHKNYAKECLNEDPNYYRELSKRFWQLPKEKIDKRNKSISQSLKRYWSDLSDEERNERMEPLLNGLNLYWENISPEEKKERIDKMFKGLEVWKSNLSDEEISNLMNVFVIWKNNLSDEELSQLKEKQRNSVINYFNNLSEKEKEARRIHLSEVAKKRWNDYSPEEKERRINILREAFTNYWNNLTPEEFSKWNLKRSINQGIVSTKPRDTEIEFMNLLKIFDIKYQFQYYNKIEHPDFKTIFPYNPITGSDKINPFHRWDFIVFNDLGNVLIDIDGSIHTIKPGKTIINGLDIGAYNQFKDIQRLYQTDNLRAYIVLAYDDTLNMDTPVYSIQSQEIILVKDLILIIRNDKKERV